MNRLNSKYLLNCKPQVAKWSLQYPNSLSQAHTHYSTLTLMIPTPITYSEQIQELFISNYTHTCHFNTISIFFKSLRNLISWANMWKKVWKLESFRAVEVQSHVPSNSTLRGKGTHFLHFLQSHTFSVRNAMVHSSSTLPWVYNTKIPRKKEGICKIGTVDILCQNSIEKGLCLAKNYKHSTKTYKIVNLFSPGVSLPVTSGLIFSNLSKHDQMCIHSFKMESSKGYFVVCWKPEGI